GEFGGARAEILGVTPRAACLARVCYRYCEAACPVGKKGDPVAVRHIKRAALDYGGAELPYAPPGPTTGQRGAVVGGGPAGLMVAWVLGHKGHEVTVFEATDRL